MGSLSKKEKEHLQYNIIRNLQRAIFLKNIISIIMYLAEAIELLFADYDTTKNNFFWSKEIINKNSNALFACLIIIRNDVIAHSNNNRIITQLPFLMNKHYNESIELIKSANGDNSLIQALDYLKANMDAVIKELSFDTFNMFYNFAVNHGMTFDEAFKMYSNLYETTNIDIIVSKLQSDGLLEV